MCKRWAIHFDLITSSRRPPSPFCILHSAFFIPTVMRSLHDMGDPYQHAPEMSIVSTPYAGRLGDPRSQCS